MNYLEAKDKIKICFFLALLVLVIIIFPKITTLYYNTESFLINSGTLGPLIYSLLIILAILISPIPTSPLAIISGSVFGPYLGMLYTLISATIGAVLAFLIARFLLRDFIENRFQKNKIYKKIAALEYQNENKIAYFVFLTRLMPQVSFDFISYLAGLTHIKVWKFALATFLGMIPIVFVLTFFGYLIAPYKIFALAILFILFIAYSIYKIKKTM